LHEIVRKAHQVLGRNEWDTIVGGSESETTVRRNRKALDSIAFRPRVLRNVRHVDMSVTCLGKHLRLPIAFAPIGGLDTFDPGGGSTVARAAALFGVGQFLSSLCAPGLEAVAATAPDMFRAFQLYVRGDDSFVLDYVRRVVDSGYSAICITVDSA